MADSDEVGKSRLRRLRGDALVDADAEESAAPPAPLPPAAPATAVGGAPAPRRRASRSLRARVVVVVLAVVFGAVAGGASAIAVALSSPTYQSQALLEIDQPRAIAASGDDGVVAKLSRLRFKYAGLVRTQVFSVPVSQQLGLKPSTVTRALYSAADSNSLLLAVGARAGTRELARLIAQAAAQLLTTYVRDEQNNNKIPAAQQVTFTIATQAGVVKKVSPTTRRVVLVGVGSFVFVTGVLLGLSFLGRRRDA